VSQAPSARRAAQRTGAKGLGAAQRWLFERVTSPLGSSPTHPSDDARWVIGAGQTSSDRIAIYQRAYFARLVECLRDDYPALEHAAGAADFEALCLAFIQAHPPEHVSLNVYGAPFAGFCATRPSPHAVFWSELARLEWAVVECIHADAEGGLDPQALANVDERHWPRVRLVPSPAARVLVSSHPVDAYYRAFLEGDRPEPPMPEPRVIVVCRRRDDVWRFALDARWAGLLRSLLDGERLESALGAAAETAGDSSAAELQAAFSQWVACGLFSGIRSD